MEDTDFPPGSGSGLEGRPRIGRVIASVLAAALVAVGLISIAGTIRSPAQLTGQTSIETPTPDASALVSDAPVATAAPPSAGITQDEAIAMARDVAPDAAGWAVRVVKAGPFEEIFTAGGEFDWSRDIPRDRWIWQVTLGTGGALDSHGVHVFIDYANGTVYHVLRTRG